jgi:hypothetical protein
MFLCAVLNFISLHNLPEDVNLSFGRNVGQTFIHAEVIYLGGISLGCTAPVQFLATYVICIHSHRRQDGRNVYKVRCP